MTMVDPNTIAFLAAFFTMIGYLPQAIKTIKTRDTKGISFWMYFFSLVGVVLWLLFGIMISNVLIVLKNIAVIILGGVIFWIKVKNILSGKDGVEFFLNKRQKINKEADHC